ncbi:unnamed protein product [Auanema sp. JU1783]|nr:unnamed protein product [Auanema sp. JU1783]
MNLVILCLLLGFIMTSARGQSINYTGSLDFVMMNFVRQKGMLHNCTMEHISISKQIDTFATRYILPFYFVFGSIGNVLNLCVLLTMNSEMSVANILFAGVALADLSLLFTMTTTVVAAWPYFYTKNTMRWFFYHTHFLTVMLTNAFLCISSWFVSAISIERYLSIRDPIRIHRRRNYKWRVHLMIIGIIIGSVALNWYHLFEYQYSYTRICENKYLFGLIHPLEALQRHYPDVPGWLLRPISISKMAHMILAVFLPISLIAILNVRIIYMLKKSRRLIDASQEHNFSRAVYRSTSTEDARQRRDRKISITVATIVSCYIITHAPSVTPFIIEILKIDGPAWMKFYGNTVLTYWLLCGKVMNFVLFCLTSRSFRSRLRTFFKVRCDRLKIRFGLKIGKKFSNVSNSTGRVQSLRLLSPIRDASFTNPITPKE